MSIFLSTTGVGIRKVYKNFITKNLKSINRTLLCASFIYSSYKHEISSNIEHGVSVQYHF